MSWWTDLWGTTAGAAAPSDYYGPGSPEYDYQSQASRNADLVGSSYIDPAMLLPPPPPPPPTQADMQQAMDQLIHGDVVGATKPPMDTKTKVLIAGGALLVAGAVYYSTKGGSSPRRRRSRR